ncbi:hypothetical protein [Saliphagus sp. LR7]|uniref:hypothetical protein n=1 Tax=Saliphagus sp. LR7 TaxID=2282654 RepID=UPI000DF84572|nr:hypothetical protein [Saliphagus sp. LR7]
MIEKKRSENVLDNDPPSADEDVAKLRLQLSHFSLTELEREEVVNWDRDEHVVRKGPRFDEKWKENEWSTGQ